MNAYDYQKQTWVSGNVAVDVAVKQMREELALLEGERGDEFARFVNIPNKDAAIKALKLHLSIYE